MLDGLDASVALLQKFFGYLITRLLTSLRVGMQNLDCLSNVLKQSQ